VCDVRLGSATALFALLLAALICAAEFVPPKQTTSAVVAVKEQPAPVVVAPSKCAQETWPNITTDCLRNADHERPVGNARLIVAEPPVRS